MFDLIKSYFAMGLYTNDDMETLKLGGLLTADQYTELVGDTDKTDTTTVKA